MSEDCGQGLECLRRMCTTACEDDGACRPFGSDAVCVAPEADACTIERATGLCTLRCATDERCTERESGLVCDQGQCEPARCGGAEAGTPDAALVGSAEDDAAITSDGSAGDAADVPDAPDPPIGQPDAAMMDAAPTDAEVEPESDAGEPLVTPLQHEVLTEFALAARELIVDPVRSRLYATVAPTASAYASHLVTIDLDTLQIVHAVEVGGDPVRMAISEDGSTMWIGFGASAAIRKIDLSGAMPAPGPTYSLASSGDVVWMTVLEGTTNSVAVQLADYTFVLADDGVPRSPMLGATNRLAAGPAGYLFGYDDLSSGFGFNTIALDDSGTVSGSTTYGLVYGYNNGIVYDPDGFVYSTNGSVVSVADPSAPRRAGLLPHGGFISPDRGSDLALMLTPRDTASDDLTLRAFDTATFTQRRAMTFTEPVLNDSVHSLVHRRPGTVAFIGDMFAGAAASVFVLRAPALFEETAPADVLVPQLSGDVLELPLSALALVADPMRQRLYATVGASAPAYPNQLVTIDPADGSVLDAVWVGSQPGALAISEDATTLWVSIVGSHSLRRVDLTGTYPAPGPTYPFPRYDDDSAYAQTLTALPGQSASVIATLYSAAGNFTNVYVFDDGVQRGTGNGFGPQWIASGPPGYVFGRCIGDTFCTFAVTANGLEERFVGYDLVDSKSIYLRYDPDGFVYGALGEVLDVSDPEQPVAVSPLPPVGLFAWQGAVLPLPGGSLAINVVPDDAFPRYLVLRRLDASTSTLIDTRRIGADIAYTEVLDLLYLAPDTLAFRASASLGAGASVLLFHDADLLSLPD